MLVHAAKELARQWVLTEGSKLPGFEGAFYHGSTNWLADDAELPATSDLDIMLVFSEAPSVKLGKFVYQGIILEVSSMAWAALGSAEQLLGTAHMAGSFMNESVIADPTGRLAALQKEVSRNYAKRTWVMARCANAQEKILRNLDGVRTDTPFPEQVMAWLFATGVTTHVLLVAGLRNPTVRKRYLAVRELLAAYDRLDFYEPLLDLLGCTQLSQAQVQQHLDALTAAYDVAKTVIKTPFFYAADINDLARPVAIEGSQELIDQGDHREAIFWIVATYARCQIIFNTDATPAVQAQFTPGFHALLADLGIHDFADLVQRSTIVREFLPRLWHEAEAIVATNPAIESE